MERHERLPTLILGNGCKADILVYSYTGGGHRY